jgi:ABC-type bacteriocin/lantibiotic exporter with double-glycine peptidase domain
MSTVLPLHHIQQPAEGYCLPACVCMMLAYLGLEYPEPEVNHIFGAHESGTPSFAVQRLSVLGLQVIHREWSVSQLLRALDTDQPVILFVRTGFLDHWKKDVAYAVIAVGAEEGQRFWLHDPALSSGPVTASWDGLLAAWAEFGYRGAVISAAPLEESNQ